LLALVATLLALMPRFAGRIAALFAALLGTRLRALRRRMHGRRRRGWLRSRCGLRCRGMHGSRRRRGLRSCRRRFMRRLFANLLAMLLLGRGRWCRLGRRRSTLLFAPVLAPRLR
jgi:hypothetical protein